VILPRTSAETFKGFPMLLDHPFASGSRGVI
jgi:hypothetical protein